MEKFLQFDPRTISCGDSSATVLTKRGGLTVSFVWHGRELFYYEEDTILDTSREVRGGIPVLFPACGRMQEGKYDTVPKHGFARGAEWNVVEQSADTLTLSITDNDTTRGYFPHGFTFLQTYRIEADKLTLSQEIKNTGENALPFSLGFHPYFKIDPAVSTAMVPSDRYEDTTGKYSFDGKFQFKNDYDSVCTNTKGDTSVLDTGLGYNITVRGSEPFLYTVVWSPTGAQFACIEPWTATPNALNTGFDIITLAPGESASFAMEISASEAV